jgi:lipopolysaccharide/colanic/teichoic acid biosynthesis glycosyltransferase
MGANWAEPKFAENENREQVRSLAKNSSGKSALKMNSNSEQTSERAPSVSPSGLPFWKRALDLVCILITAPLWLPVMFVLGLLIRIVSPGPVLFRQERVGFLGRRFTCFKFRTMAVNADTGVHKGYLNHLMDSNVPMKKLDVRDSRLIPCGLILRSLGLDELPQLFNILRGDMSLVGPRPCVPYEYEQYTARHRRRLEAVPGLTGLWQVSGKNRTTFEQMIDLDIAYAENKKLFLDLKIIFKTIPAIVMQTRDVQDAKSSARVAPLKGAKADTTY